MNKSYIALNIWDLAFMLAGKNFEFILYIGPLIDKEIKKK